MSTENTTDQPQPRFVVMDDEQAKSCENAGAFDIDNPRWPHCGSFLVDTATNTIVFDDDFTDCPEDMTLGRGLAPLVGLLNQLAAGERA